MWNVPQNQKSKWQMVAYNMSMEHHILYTSMSLKKWIQQSGSSSKRISEIEATWKTLELRWGTEWTATKRFTHFSPALHFILKPIIWFAVQIKWLFSIWKAALGWNGLKHLQRNVFGRWPKNMIYTPPLPEIHIYMNLLHVAQWFHACKLADIWRKKHVLFYKSCICLIYIF